MKQVLLCMKKELILLSEKHYSSNLLRQVSKFRKKYGKVTLLMYCAIYLLYKNSLFKEYYTTGHVVLCDEQILWEIFYKTLWNWMLDAFRLYITWCYGCIFN